MINHRQLEAFNAVVVTGATTRAAEILGVSQPAISRLIKHLEYSTKLKLFERSNGRLILTREGTIFYAEVNRAFHTLGRLSSVAEDIRNYRAHPLNVGAIPALSYSFVPHVVGAFHKMYPQAIVNLEPGSSDSLRDLVASGHLDLSFVANEVDISGVFAEQFSITPAVCVMPRGHALAEKAIIQPADLANQPFISLSHNDRARHRIDHVFEHHNIARKIVAETHYALSVCQLSQQGLGIGLAHPYCLDTIETGSIVVKPFLPRITFKTMMIYAPTSPVTGSVENFRTIAHEMATSYLDRLMQRFGVFNSEEAFRAFGEITKPGPWIRNPLA